MRRLRCAILAASIAVWPGAILRAQQRDPAPTLVVETTRGTFAIETYPDDAPQTVAHVVKLAKEGFYDGQRIHRAIDGLLVQWGDPRSRDLSRQADWGRGAEASSGRPIGVSEITDRRRHVKGAVGVAHPGLSALADSQIFLMLATLKDLDGRYTVFGHVVEGSDVPDTLQVEDEIIRVSVKP